MARSAHAARRGPPSAKGTDAEAIAGGTALVDAARTRLRSGGRGHQLPTTLTGLAFLVVVAAWIAVAARPVALVPFGACVAAFVVAGCVEFEIGPGCALPTAPVQVVALFLLPPQYVPVAVLLGLVGSSLVARARDRERNEPGMVLASSAWQSVGPAAVFAIAHATAPRYADWPVYLLAFGAQFALDGIASWLHSCRGLGVPFPRLAAALRFTFLCDLCLAPVGFAAVLAVPGSPAALAFLLPPIALLAVVQADRRQHLDAAIALGAAFADTSDLARRDVLTGLRNRLAWEEKIAELLAATTPVGVILADVDGLKHANDHFGHDAGDRLLIAVGEVLARSIARTGDRAIGSDTVGTDVIGADAFRIGGDEFGILLTDVTQDAVDAHAATLRDGFDAAPGLDGRIRVSASIGSALAPGGIHIDRAIAHADRAVNLDKINRGVRRRV